MNLRPIYILVIIGIIAGTIFLTFPQLDIWFSSLFHKAGEGFYLRNDPFVFFIYRFMRYLVISLVIFCGVILIYNRLRKKDLIFSSRQVVFLLLVLAIGPGLFVNTVLKDNWQRARPVQIIEFGGDKKFSPVIKISDQCVKNCSFTSGHASVGFFFVCFAFLLKRGKALAYMGGVLLGFLFGMGRVIQGGHFISDVIFSGIFVLLTAHIIHDLMFNENFFIRIKRKRG